MSSVNPAILPPNTYAAIWGPPLIAVFLASILYGITVFQTFYYYSHYGRRDRVSWLILVAVIFTLDTVAMALMMAYVYFYLVSSWGMPEKLLPDIQEGAAEYFTASILTFVVQGFYINTIRALHAPLIVTTLLLIVSLLALGIGFVLPVIQLRFVDVMNIITSPLSHIAFNIARGTALACDLGIVAALCWLLEIRRTNIRRANNVLDSLMMFAVQRGILQALVQGGELISYAVEPASILFLPFHIIVSRIYCLSVLATLNSREYVLSRGLTSDERERKRMKDDRQIATLELAVVDRQVRGDRASTTTKYSRGWGSTLRTSRPVLSSYLDPPFLLSSSDPDADIAVHFTEGNSRLNSNEQSSFRGDSSSAATSLPPSMLKNKMELSRSCEEINGIEISGPLSPDLEYAYITAKSGA